MEKAISIICPSLAVVILTVNRKLPNNESKAAGTAAEKAPAEVKHWWSIIPQPTDEQV